MLEEGRVLYGLDDVCIIPAKKSTIVSRSECKPFRIGGRWYDTKMLPIFVAPMSCLTNTENIQNLATPCTVDDQGTLAGIQPILSRGTDLNTRIEHLKQGFWVAFGVREVSELEKRSEELLRGTISLRVCIDVANGHMDSVFEASRILRKRFGAAISIMVGNIANPETYQEFLKEGNVDYVRLGIGSGNVCTTSVQTGIHYPMASLISDCKKIANSFDGVKEAPAIVADGGFNRIDQCVKALALGADYVMLGRIVAQSDKACGKVFTKVKDSFVPENEVNSVGCNLYREYYGMSTKKAQREFNPDRPVSELRHSEGLETFVPIKYTLTEWLQDFTHALKSSMSYTGHRYLETFINDSVCMPMSRTDFNAYMYKEI